jgi:hypothetical protein
MSFSCPFIHLLKKGNPKFGPKNDSKGLIIRLVSNLSITSNYSETTCAYRYTCNFLPL